jgi:hypothetical protein
MIDSPEGEVVARFFDLGGFLDTVFPVSLNLTAHHNDIARFQLDVDINGVTVRSLEVRTQVAYGRQ